MPGPSKMTVTKVEKLYERTKKYQEEVGEKMVDLLKEQNKILEQIRDKLPPVNGPLSR